MADALEIRRAYLRDYARKQGWNSPMAFNDEDAEIFLHEVGPVADQRVLEIGYGEGRFLAWAIAGGAEVWGLETDDSLFAEARAAGVHLVDRPLAELAADRRGTFDLIVAFDVFEHLTLTEIDTMFGHCEALLRTGGRLALRFPNAQSPFGLMPQYGDLTHVTALSLAIVEQLVIDRLWTVARKGAAWSPRGRGLRAMSRGVRRLARLPLEKMISFLYTGDAPLAPVVTIVLRRAG